MKTLIIAGEASSSGCLKALRKADATMGLWPRLIVGPPPDPETVARIFGPEDKAFDEAFSDRRGPVMPRDDRRFPGSTKGLAALCANFDRVELWFDPVAESQLALALVLDHLRDDPRLAEKLTLVHPERMVGRMRPEEAALLQPRREPATAAHLDLASRVWTAWRNPTPEAFARLLDQDLSPFPFLHRNILRLLEELPAPDSGLAASERIMLGLADQGASDVHAILTPYHQAVWPETYSGFDAGQLLDDLCHAAEPAILGLPPGPYDLALMEDEPRRKAYTAAPLSLSDFGRRLLDGRADFAQGRPAHRWWGGTELDSGRGWRWDAAARRLHPRS